MASLTGQTISSTYDSLLKVTDNGPLNSSLRTITDGLGNSSSLQLSTIAAYITGGLTVTGQLQLGSTISNGTYTYTLPSATGTLALTSDIHSAVTLSAIGSTANANGATLTGQVLNLQPADASFGGVVTTGTQTFAGAKIFSNDIRVNTINIGLGGGAVITNTRVGVSALSVNTSGDFNTANGYYSLFSNTSGNSNTANGTVTIANNTTGSFNTAYGSSAGSINTTGSNNIFLGYNSDGQSATESNRTWIGNTDTTSTWVGGNLLLGTRTNATSDKLQVTGSAKITGQITLGSTITNGTYTYTLPSATGTLALTSALSAYVPYTGATGDVDLGTNNGITLTDTGSNTSINVTSSSTGQGAILVTKSGNGEGIRVLNGGIGSGFLSANTSTGIGFYINNSSTGIGLKINNDTSATGDPFIYTLNNVSKAKIDYLGNITGVAATFTGNSVFKNNDSGNPAVTFRNENGSGITAQWLTSANTVAGTIFNSGLISTTPQGDLYGSAVNSFTSSQLAASLTDETGTGSVVFSASPTFTGVPIFGSSISNGTYTYTLPSATGTLALTSALSGYLPLSGGTLTGALSGTSASFSGNVNVGVNNEQLLTISGGNLSVSGNTGTARQIALLTTSGGNAVLESTYQGASSFGSLILRTSSTDRLTIASTGAATFSGIVNASAGRVNIQGTNQNSVWLNQNAGGTSSGFLIGRSLSTTDSQDFFIYDVAAAATRLVISSTGNVGIGQTIPTQPLEVRTGTDKILQILTSGDLQIQSINDAKTANVPLNIVGSTLALKVGATTALSIASTGAATFSQDVKLGDTSQARHLDLFITAPLDGKIYWGSSASPRQSYIGADGTPRITAQCNGSGGVQLTSGATSWASLSDENVKVMTEWKTFINPLEKIISLRAGTSRYKTDSEDISRSFLIAQDVQKVLPEAVSIDDDGILGLRYTEVIPLMIAAIQEQQAQIEELKALIK